MSAATTTHRAEPPRAAHLHDPVGVEINEVPDGLVVYDTAAGRVHYLNPTAAAVYLLCTGEADVEAIAAEVQELWELPEAPLQVVRECIADLADRRLVVR